VCPADDAMRSLEATLAVAEAAIRRDRAVGSRQDWTRNRSSHASRDSRCRTRGADRASRPRYQPLMRDALMRFAESEKKLIRIKFWRGTG
jgi:hypothetical protein